ncbi:hypothetical protein EV424DRAFT_1556638 [Suillus variegatus]|nr:hypothetical protein EV424DRAFT_1556638 [Suillus variegatus]
MGQLVNTAHTNFAPWIRQLLFLSRNNQEILIVLDGVCRRGPTISPGLVLGKVEPTASAILFGSGSATLHAVKADVLLTLAPRGVLECCKQTRKEEDKKDDTHTHAFARLARIGHSYMVDGTTREFIAGLINEFASEHILMSLEEILECVEGSKTDVSAFRSLKTWLSNSGGEPRGTSRLSKDQRQGILLAPKRRSVCIFAPSSTDMGVKTQVADLNP